jgi:hypothetical protein
VTEARFEWAMHVLVDSLGTDWLVRELIGRQPWDFLKLGGDPDHEDHPEDQMERQRRAVMVAFS